MENNIFSEHARAIGIITAGNFRVVVIESDNRISHKDFASHGEACVYADDAAQEADDNAPIAKVFDANFNMIYQGKSLLY